MTIDGDRVRITVAVPVPPAVAFEVFTLETDSWWRRGPAYRVAGRRPGTLVFEPRLGGRLFEQYDAGDGPRTHVTGTITAWSPPEHLAFEWVGASFARGEVTYVDVRFVATAIGTRVELEHRGFAALGPDHPVRHGKPAGVFVAELGRWWGSLLMTMRERAISAADAP